DARTMAAAGADGIVAQGGEAGGHRSVDGKPASPESASVGTIVLVPQVVEAVRVPVVAAGGIADGRGLVAALALGASGILLGTRFVATRESMAAEIYKKRVLESDSTATTLTDTISGLWARALRNRFTEEYRASGAPVLPPHVQRVAAGDVYQASLKNQDPDYYPMMTGQSTGLIHDLPGAAEGRGDDRARGAGRARAPAPGPRFAEQGPQRAPRLGEVRVAGAAAARGRPGAEDHLGLLAEQNEAELRRPVLSVRSHDAVLRPGADRTPDDPHLHRRRESAHVPDRRRGVRRPARPSLQQPELPSRVHRADGGAGTRGEPAPASRVPLPHLDCHDPRRHPAGPTPSSRTPPPGQP